MNYTKGVLLVFLGAVCFSVKAIMIKMAYGHTVDAVTLLTLRMTFSLPFFLIVPFIYKKKEHEAHVTGKDHFHIFLLGILGYYVASIFDFWGLQYVTAGLERLILFVYPTIVVLLSALFLRKRITSNIVFALLLTYFGIAIIFSDAELERLGDIPLGATLIFVSAFTYAAYLVGSGRLIPKIGSVQFNAYAMIVSCLAVMAHFAFTWPSDIFHLPTQIYYYGIALALISTVIPTFMVAEGINLIGPSAAAIVASIGPVITLFLGHWFLDEPITTRELFGTVFVVGGVLWVSYTK